MEFTMGHYLGFLGAGLAVTLAGIGSAIAVARAGQAVAGVCAETPERFSKLLILQLLPATQGVYGFIISFLIILNMGALGTVNAVSVSQGWGYVVGALPVGIGGLFSALYQGKVACSGIMMVGKRPETQGRAITSTAIVEMYAIFGLIASFFIVFMGIKL